MNNVVDMGLEGGVARVIHEDRWKAPVFGFFLFLSFGALFHFFLSLATNLCLLLSVLSFFPPFSFGIVLMIFGCASAR